MTFQTRNTLDPAAQVVAGAPVCALIEQYFGASEPSAPMVAENVERLRRQLALLNIEEIVGLGDMPQGASLLLLRGDVLFELATIEAMAKTSGRGAQIDDVLAAVHVEAGDAAAALSKFRRDETGGWKPFQIRFVRLGTFKPAKGTLNALAFLMRKRAAPIAKAALLPIAKAEANEPLQSVWARAPGLDPIVRVRKVYALQKDAFDAFGLKPSAWQGVGFLLLIVMLSFGVLGWVWAGAAIGLLAAGAFDLAERASDLKDLRLSKSSNGSCVQALVVGCLWLFAVFAAKQGSTAQVPALLLLVLPAAFILAQATDGAGSKARDAAFGVFLHALLVTFSVTMLSVPLASMAFSAFALLLMLFVVASAAAALITQVIARASIKSVPVVGAG